MPTVECGFSGGSGRDDLTGFGPSIRVDIGYDPAWLPGAIPKADDRNIPALIDTGAQECFIDCDLATRLKLPIRDRREISGSRGRHEVDVYDAQIHIPNLAFTQYGQFAGVFLARGGFAFPILMGRTFLTHFTLHYDGRAGRVTLTG
jgi:predicted aspartyl protease